MNAPQIIAISLVMLDLGFAIAKHGQPRTRPYSQFDSLINSAIWLGLMYWGGFFG